jgi:uncharacterized membrane protein YgdD (TMEM256/DUF423 family)
METLFKVGCTSGAVCVLLGAFGAHALKKHVSPQSLEIWQTAVQYHFVHTLALIFASKHCRTKTPGFLFAGGIAIFSGSLYALVLTGERRLGAITPIGGLAFAAGWIAMMLEA